MGCSLILSPGSGDPYVGNEAIASLDYDADGPLNRGSLCAKGNMALELLTHPKRLDAPLMRDNGTLRYSGWEAAMDSLVARLPRGRSVGILAGPHLTREEAGLAAKLARAAKIPDCTA